MGSVGAIIMFLGWIVAIVGAIWILIMAFQESILWGLACLFLPFVQLIFAIMFWPATKRPLTYWVAGVLLILVGGMLGGFGAFGRA